MQKKRKLYHISARPSTAHISLCETCALALASRDILLLLIYLAMWKFGRIWSIKKLYSLQNAGAKLHKRF